MVVLDPQSFYKEVGMRVRRAREDRGLTQEAVASQVGLTRTSMTNIEKGRQRVALHTLMDIAQVLAVPFIHLIPEDELLCMPEITAPIAPQFNEEEVALLIKDRPSDEQEWIKSALLTDSEEDYGSFRST
jgi:transcriptional regulator with XRE-family HTH domain